jgi:Mg2+/Co2+ transporter CorB
MDQITLIYIASTFGCLLLSAVLSAAETAIIAVSPAVIQQLSSEGNQRAKLILKLREDKDKLISTLLIANSTLDTVASALAIAATVRLFGIEGIPIATAIITILVILIAEVIPKTYAFEYADKISLYCAPILEITLRIFTPVTIAVLFIVHHIFKFFGIKLGNQKSIISETDTLRGAIQLSHSKGGVLKYKKDMLHSILDLGETGVSEVMTHRSNMVTININLPINDIIKIALDSGHTRFPAWENNPDNIVGIFHIKDLFSLHRYKGDKATPQDLLDTAIAPWFIPESTTLNEQLLSFRKKKVHFALVIDEYGALQGLVTLEDILEEIVGQIYDEHDRVHVHITTAADGAYLVSGTATIRDINRQLEWDLPDEEVSTIAGLIMYESEIIPDQGQEFLFHDVIFKIMRKKDNQIALIKMRKKEPTTL